MIPLAADAGKTEIADWHVKRVKLLNSVIAAMKDPADKLMYEKQAVNDLAEAMAAFMRAPHYLLDARLMMAWAKALNEAGKVDEARFVAQRLKEFKNAQAAEFFAPCETPAAADAGPPPFQCVAPTRLFRYEDIR